MSRCVRSPISRWNIFWLAIGLGGCAIADSTIIDLNLPHAPGTLACSSSLGSYSLPKSFIRVVIGQKKGERPDFVVFDTASQENFRFQVVRRADPALTICLDYLGSVFAHDEIKVIKEDPAAAKPDPELSATISRQFLRTIIVNAADRSVQIARNLIQAAFVGISGDPNFGRTLILKDTTTEILTDLEFDPFDTRDSAEANARLSGFGVCLVLEGFTFDRGSLSVDQYCNSPSRARNRPPRVAELYAIKSREPVPPNTPGVLYRPLQTYMISVYRKDDPSGRGRWTLSRRIDVSLENLSPVISVGITRAIFARRNAVLQFTEGTLTTVCIAKSSEIENFVAIPFEVARSIVALPAQIVQVKINRIAKETELARVQDVFVKTQAAIVKARIDQAKMGNVPAGTETTVPPIKPNDVFKSGAPTGLAVDANTFTLGDTGAEQKRQSELIAGLCDPGFLVDLPTGPPDDPHALPK